MCVFSAGNWEFNSLLITFKRVGTSSFFGPRGPLSGILSTRAHDLDEYVLHVQYTRVRSTSHRIAHPIKAPVYLIDPIRRSVRYAR